MNIWDACEKGNFEEVKKKLENGVNINERDV